MSLVGTRPPAMSIKEREEFLFQKLREKDPDIVADGVICEQEFLNARWEILPDVRLEKRMNFITKSFCIKCSV